MEIKYCEHCGVLLGLVNPTKKYCSDCKREVSLERKRARRKTLKSGHGFTPVRSICQWCGEPMVKTSAAQKYHNGCAKKAYNAKANLNAKTVYKVKQQEKKKREKTFPSIGEVQALADKLGKHYGEVSQMLATGELTYERKLLR